MCLPPIEKFGYKYPDEEPGDTSQRQPCFQHCNPVSIPICPKKTPQHQNLKRNNKIANYIFSMVKALVFVPPDRMTEAMTEIANYLDAHTNVSNYKMSNLESCCKSNKI
jgi:hypothetical protein